MSPSTRWSLVAMVAAAAACRDYFVASDFDVDGGTDASSLDATSSSDAFAGDGAEAGDAAPAPFCVRARPAAVFCDDFDEGALGSTWDSISKDFETLDEGLFVSAPRSMRVLVDRDIGTEYSSKLIKDVGTAANLRVDFDLRVERAGPVYPFGVFCGPNGYKMSFTLDDDKVTEQGAGIAFKAYSTSASFPPGVWRHISFLLRRTAGSVEMKLDDATVLPETVMDGKSELAKTTCSLYLGIYDAPAHAQWDARFDNVLVTSF